MNVRSEIHMLRMGLRNNDFRPGQEREAAVHRLNYLTRITENGTDRPRGVIILGNR